VVGIDFHDPLDGFVFPFHGLNQGALDDMVA
jgi:hypothetical protein